MGTDIKSKLSKELSHTVERAYEARMLKVVKRGPVPMHLAIIMDGNRRWAEAFGKKGIEGHKEGKSKLEEVMEWCREVGIKVLTVYAFSTENVRRDEEEVEALMELFIQSFRELAKDERVHRYKIRVRVIGDRSMLPEQVLEAIKEAEDATKDYDSYFFNLAVAYGGREEIVEALKKIASDVRDGVVDIEDINEELVSKYMYTADLPDPDLILRTSGEIRISNFLLWQLAYSELYFADVYWPGFRKIDFLRAIRTYQMRKRRFGK